MKKNLVLFSLFVLPIVAYLFFASGVNSFIALPVITPKVSEFGAWKDHRGETVHLEGKITVLGFGGQELLKNRGNLFNLNQSIYQRYHKFKDLQFVMLCPTGTEKDANYILSQFAPITDVSQWHFVFAPPAEITTFHQSLQVNQPLSQTFGSTRVYLIDKKRQLRGRKEETERHGYDTFHPSELNNEMLDDFKILLYEYRAAFKRNLEKKQTSDEKK